MLKWLYGLMIFAVVTIGIYFILKLGYEPSAELVMKPSFFTRPEEIGAAVLRRFYSPVVEDKLVFFGIPPRPEFHQRVVKGFLLAAAVEKAPFDVILAEEQMPPLDISGLGPIDLQIVETNAQYLDSFVERVKTLRASGKRVLVLTASIFSSHLLQGNSINRYEAMTGEHVLSITSAALALNSSSENLVDPPCVGTERDRSGTADLGCAIMKAGRGYYRKQFHSDHFIAIMNSPKPVDYLLMIAPPATGAPLASK